MPFIFLGVDVAGAKNTWVAGLAETTAGLEAVYLPGLRSLQEIVDFCETNDVVAAAIDAPLTISLAEDSGFRLSDLELRRLLPPDCRNWVSSLNSLMAVPVRGMLLAERLSPLVGTILETHPRASLFFTVDESLRGAVRGYKREPGAADRIRALWKAWSAEFKICCSVSPVTDGALDALVCATTAYLYHRDPGRLLRLRHPVADKSGRGPFYVVKAIRQKGNGAIRE